MTVIEIMAWGMSASN